MRLLVIGCGSIGTRHAKNAQPYADVHVYDSNYQQSKKIAEKLNVGLFKNLQDAWEWQPDLTIIASPHTSHVSLSTAAILSGSNVLLEKPLSHSYDGVEALLTLAKQKQKNLFLCCNMRFHPGVKTLHQNLHHVGKILFARLHCGEYLPTMRPGRDYSKLYASQQSAGGGVILDAIHEIDYSIWLFGNATEVHCVAKKLSDLNIDVEDYASIQLSHETGICTEIHLDYLQRHKQRGCEIIGTEGTLVWQSLGKHPEQCEVKLFLTSTNQWKHLYYNRAVDGNKPYIEMLEEVFRTKNQPSHLLASGHCGAKALRVALNALQSAQNKSIKEKI